MTLTMQPTKQNDVVANNNNYKVSKNKTTTDEDINNQIHSQIKIHLKSITYIENTKNWTWRNTKQTWTLLNTKNCSWQSTKHIWTLLNTKNWLWQNTKQIWTLLNIAYLNFGESNNKHIQIQQTSKLPTKKVNENIQSKTNKYTLFIPVTEKSEERKAI